MAKLIGAEKVHLALRIVAKKLDGQKGSVYFGYSQPYARRQHETHKTQAKFLERPFRRMKSSGRLKLEVIESYRTTGKMQPALKAAAQQILEESQIDVPVETGALRASSFIASDKELIGAMIKARTEGNQLRLK